MGRTRSTLVAVAFALVSCSAQATPAATPIQQAMSLRLYTTPETTLLLQSLSAGYRQQQPQIAFETTSASYTALAARVLRENGSYFFSHHLPDDIDSPTSPYWAAPVGQDALSVIVHPTNNIAGLATAQLRQVYTGEVGTWDMLGGGAAGEIAVLTSADSAALRREFDALVLGERAVAPAAQVVPHETAMLRSVERQPASIGYASLSALDERVRALPIDGVLPTADSVYDSTYPLRTTIYIVGRSEPQDDAPEIRAFIGWVQSLEGQQIVGQHYAPLLRP